MIPDWVFEGRLWLSLAPAAGVLWALALSAATLSQRTNQPTPSPNPLRITLLEPSPDTASAPDAAPTLRQAISSSRLPMPLTAANNLKGATQSVTSEVSATSIATERPTLAVTPPPSPVLPSTAQPARPGQPSLPEPERFDAQLSYARQLRAHLEQQKRYPTSREARLQRPAGEVRVWIDVARDGSLHNAGIERGSGSMILDAAALSTVRRGRLPAFPADAWPGVASHRFTVTLDYSPDAS